MTSKTPKRYTLNAIIGDQKESIKKNFDKLC